MPMKGNLKNDQRKKSYKAYRVIGSNKLAQHKEVQ